MLSRGKSWAPSPLGAVDGDAFARHQLGQRVDLTLDAFCPFGVDVDQSPAGMLATERIARRNEPALGVLVEDNEILGRRDADHDLAQLAPFVMCAEGRHAGLRRARRYLRNG